MPTTATESDEMKTENASGDGEESGETATDERVETEVKADEGVREGATAEMKNSEGGEGVADRDTAGKEAPAPEDQTDKQD